MSTQYTAPYSGQPWEVWVGLVVVIGTLLVMVVVAVLGDRLKAWQKDACPDCGGELEWEAYNEQWHCEKCNWREWVA